jgi:hypothetical protein
MLSTGVADVAGLPVSIGGLSLLSISLLGKPSIDFEPARLGKNSRTLHRDPDHPISKDNQPSVPQGEDGKSRAKNQDRIAISKLRRSFSSHNKGIENRKRARALDGSPPVRPNSEVNSSSPASDISPPNPLALRNDLLERSDVKKYHYGKRPRHKTKADKYDPKIGPKSRDVGEADTGKQRSSKRRRKKSGLVLNSDFKAPNAAQDRLTLKANSGPGLFHKGKASSPVRRRGMPDLSFTKMNFLSKPQDDSESKQRDLNHARASKSKEKENDRAKQISEYFERYPVAKSCLESQARPGREQKAAQKPYKISIPSPASNRDLKQRPRAAPDHGLRRQSAQKKDCNRPGLQKHQSADFKQQEEDHSQHQSITPSNHKQVGTSSSYCSWTVTSSGQGRSLKGDIRGAAGNAAQIPRLGSPHVDEQYRHGQSLDGKYVDGQHPHGQNLHGQHLGEQRHHVTKEHSDKISHRETENDPAYESPASQSPLDQYTKSMLLGSKQDLWNRFPGQDRAAELYTLNDLKCLARLDKFEVSHGQPSAPQVEVVPSSRPDRKTLCNHDFGENDSHDLYVLAGQKGSTGTPHAIINSGQHLLTRQTRLPISSTNMASRSAEPVSKDDTWLGLPRRQYPGFSGTIHGYKAVQARSRSTRSPAQLIQYPHFSHGYSETLLGAMSSTVIPPALRSHQQDHISTQRICTQTIRDTAQQIIHDLEQEELLISQRHTQHHIDINDEDDVADVVMGDISYLPSRTVSLQAHKHALDHPTTLPRTPDAHFEHTIIGRNQRSNTLYDDGPAEGGDPHQQHPSAETNESSSHPVEHHHYQLHPSRKNMRFTTDSRDEDASLAVLDDDGVVEGVKEGRRHDDQYALDLAGFWRPHVLY